MTSEARLVQYVKEWARLEPDTVSYIEKNIVLSYGFQRVQIFVGPSKFDADKERAARAPDALLPHIIKAFNRRKWATIIGPVLRGMDVDGNFYACSCTRDSVSEGSGETKAEALLQCYIDRFKREQA